MKCPLCDQDIKREIEEITEVGKKGIIGLVNASKRRNDNKHKHFQSATKLFVHTSCRKDYTRSETISKDARVSNYPPSEPGPSTSRISTPQFNFKICCFFCSKSFEDETKKPIEKRRIVHSVTTLNFQDRVKEVGLERNDVWGNNVFERLNSAYDLVAEEAKYHKDCHTTFMRPIDTAESDKQPSYLTRAFQEVRTYMENSTDCQFSQAELLGIITGEKPQWRWIKLELERTYGDRILVTPGSNRHDLPVICFRDTGLKILSASWYEQKSKNITDEKIRIVQMAANIIRQDIQSQVYSKETYPPSEDFLKNPGSVANSLTVFLETLLKNKRNRRVSETKRKSVALGNAITAIVRPRSFVSPLLASISLLLYRKFGSRNLVDLLANLGFCETYHEAQKLEMSTIQYSKPGSIIKTGNFNQFVFDNIDFNVCTIDGLNTFHAMGGIRCITPSSSIEKGSEMPRLKESTSTKDMGSLGIVPLQTFQGSGASLQSVKVKQIEVPNEAHHPELFDTLWLVAKHEKIPLPEWKGYLTSITTGDFSEKTRVITLPFINAPPSDYETIYTSLHYANELIGATHKGVEGSPQRVIITFDQPLYWKAREIVAAAPSESPISKCVIRLGGFHLLMSYLGCIGYLMAGSGLKELLSTVFAQLSVDKMLQGHAFARAVRGHLIVSTALATKILDLMQLTKEEKTSVQELLTGFLDKPPSLTAINEHPIVKQMTVKFGDKLQELTVNGPTAKLWIQYFRMVCLMKEYIHAERSGNWQAHLSCVKRMIPYFHAAGHFPYAKSSHLYVQDMEDLPNKMNSDEYNKFVTSGYFTMRRTDRFWSGVWSDMVIETTLMRSFKSRGKTLEQLPKFEEF